MQLSSMSYAEPRLLKRQEILGKLCCDAVGEREGTCAAICLRLLIHNIHLVQEWSLEIVGGAGDV